MAKRVAISEDQLGYLREAVERGLSYPQMARRIGVCTDTCKRILHRNGIVFFEGAKYAYQKPLTTWDRPCIKCKSTQPRPKNQYLCDSCSPAQFSEGLDGIYV